MSVAYPCLAVCRSTGVPCDGCTIGTTAVLRDLEQERSLLKQHIAYLEMKCEEHGIPFADLVAAGLVKP